MSPYINIWCPQSYAFTDYAPYPERAANPDRYPSAGNYSFYSERILKKYGQFEDRYNTFRENGNKMWWYICIGPEYPYANFFSSYQGSGVRAVLWQQYHYDIDGLLYWSVNNWQGITKNSIKNNGDGVLLYWGELFGQEFGPVASVRLEYVRDGIEDFQYLTQLEKLTDRETAMKYADNVTTSVLQFSEDYNDTENTRSDLGFYLEELYNAQ